ncbi:MAG: hypothetical protein RLZZ206_1813 [Cyanobacteriota bacterium]
MLNRLGLDPGALTAPLLSRCSMEETGSRRQERTGWAAASRNQIRVQAGSRPGAWCWMPTELIEERVGMAASAEDSQTRPRLGETQGKLCSRPSSTTKQPGGLPMAPTEGTPGATALSRRAVGFIRPAAALEANPAAR